MRDGRGWEKIGKDPTQMLRFDNSRKRIISIVKPLKIEHTLQTSLLTYNVCRLSMSLLYGWSSKLTPPMYRKLCNYRCGDTTNGCLHPFPTLPTIQLVNHLSLQSHIKDENSIKFYQYMFICFTIYPSSLLKNDLSIWHIAIIDMGIDVHIEQNRN